MAAVSTTAADWAGVAQALGRDGKLVDGGTYRVSFPRSDLDVRSQGVRIAPGLALGSYAAFARYPDGSALMMGDLVVTEEELPELTSALQAHGIEQTAIHNHLLDERPAVCWAHIHGAGDPVQLARGVKAALDVTATPAPSGSGGQQALELDTAGIGAALGRGGSAEGGVYKVSFARAEEISEHERVIPAGMGVTTALNFQPIGGGRAAMNGDIVMEGEEVQKVLKALRDGEITVVSLHNHALEESPHLFYTHFWAVGDPVALAKTLRTAVDATAPASAQQAAPQS
ncbi:MAG: DUF1259 domain-containing protein [Actinomycetota bacterium]|nr:DUF1259 domain-containing protein [Actinomycetota bacterium]